MFIMQACYGSPNMLPEMPDEMEVTDDEAVELEAPVSDTLVSVE
jgi:hypothetical protein